jgi:hypothetical protein
MSIRVRRSQARAAKQLCRLLLKLSDGRSYQSKKAKTGQRQAVPVGNMDRRRQREPKNTFRGLVLLSTQETMSTAKKSGREKPFATEFQPEQGLAALL